MSQPALSPQVTRIVGLYSFPKSGNTWLRAIIAGIMEMPGGPGVLQRYVTDTHYGPALRTAWNFQGRDWYFYKSHLKTLLREHHGQTIDTDTVIYIYRHPLDVFVSYLNFASGNVSPNAGKDLPFSYQSVDDLTPEQMETLFAIWLEHVTLQPSNKAFGNLFEHVASFKALKAQGAQVHILRYEDLYDRFNREVSRICRVLEVQDVRLGAVFRRADRRTQQNGKFFWKRQKENFRNYLTADQIARFMARYGAEMRDLGYATE